jgi:hypothetical protein
MRFYFDGIKVFKAPTLAAGKLPFYVMVDFALGRGGPITAAATTYYMQSLCSLLGPSSLSG